VFLGGVIVLIIYIRTLAANEKLFFFLDPVKSLFRLLTGATTLFIFHQKFSGLKVSPSGMIASTLYESANARILMFLMFYLLLALVSVVKLVKFESGPLIKRL